MAGVMCPRCGTVSPGDTRACPKCGTGLGADADKTGKSQRFEPTSGNRPKSPPRKPLATDAGAATAPDDTMDEGAAPPPPPSKKPAPRPGGPVPQPGAAPRRSSPNRPATGNIDASQSRAGDSLVARKIQEYLVEERLGVGGMGVVYKAVHPLIGKHVAIKVLRPDVVTDPRDMDRLLEEARVVSAIKHRGIINIFGAGTLDDGRHYLIMELLEGESLEDKMKRDGQIPAADAVVILEQVLSALSAAHEAGIVHRDLKPANVFLAKEGQQFYVKLLDFGLARRSQQNVTRIAGTPDYISPEHARGRPAGPPADLYAFGVLCFHMLTGQLPFVGNTPMEVMEKHVHMPPPVPHDVNPAIPKALSELILKLLAKDPGERPDASQVKADLRAATKQMRNAATMMSLAAIEPVTSTPEQAKEEEKRAKELARSAQVADLKRKAKKRWPYLLGAGVALWLILVLVYVLSPTEPEPVAPPLVKKGGQKDPVAHVDPGVKPGDPTNPTKVKDPDDPKGVTPPPVPAGQDAGGEAVAVGPGNDNPEALDEPDAAVEAPPQEDPNEVLDDVRLGQLKRDKRIDEKLDTMEATMKQEPSRREFFDTAHKRVKKLCDSVRTLKDFYDCEDEVGRLNDRFYKL
ncbi:MAG: protein kinase [Myxococcota bacterium]